jgi:prevent-host-death family protein
MVTLITAKELRSRMGEHLDRAHLSGETFLITRDGRGKAVLIGAQQYLDLVEQLEALQTGKKVAAGGAPKNGDRKVVSTQELKSLIK